MLNLPAELGWVSENLPRGPGRVALLVVSSQAPPSPKPQTGVYPTKLSQEFL